MESESCLTSEPLGQPTSQEIFERMLAEILSSPQRKNEISKTIEEVFSQKKAVLVMDMSGFTRTTRRHGVISFLLMNYQMRLLCKPCVEKRHGRIIKADADNLFCIFDSVDDAVRASLEMDKRLDEANLLLPIDQHLYGSFGIGYGTILNIADEDIFGDEVNLASKLGEDIADRGEILLTSAARAEVREIELCTHEAKVTVSGLLLEYHILETKH